MLNTKTIRIIINEKEKESIERRATKKGFRNVSDYIRYMTIKDQLRYGKLYKIYLTIRSKDGSYKRHKN